MPSGRAEGEPRRKRRRRGGRGGDRPTPPTTGLAEGAPPPAPVDWKPGERRPDPSRPKRDGHPPRREERGRDERGRSERGRDRRPQDAGPGGRRGAREAPRKIEAPALAAVKHAKPDFLKELGGDLLQSVSRSFYLTIKLLPEPLRAPISLGYLIARTLDTIADAAKAAPAEVRLDHLRAFADAVKYGPDAEALNGLRREIAAKLPAGDEKTLLENAPQILSWLEEIAIPDRWEIRRVIFRIAHGQALDLIRFGDGRERNALATVRELDEYTYFVAGSVGEFWTRLCERHLAGKFAKLPEGEMLQLGKRYGQGLQLINILRDLAEDLAAGRSYLPMDELVAAGLTVDDLTKAPAKARKLIEKWRRETIARLDDGWKYVRAIREWKVRYACALPILIGLDTLALLARQSPLESKTKLKVKRSAAAGTLLKAKFGVISQTWLDSMYSRRRKRAGR
jgi:farnesyl-diphosphate farnesyltransferase